MIYFFSRGGWLGACYDFFFAGPARPEACYDFFSRAGACYDFFRGPGRPEACYDFFRGGAKYPNTPNLFFAPNKK